MFVNGRMYSAVFSGVSISVVQDLFEINGAAGKVTYLCGFELSQTGTADFGDAQEEGVGLRVRSGQTSSGSGGGSAPTAVPVNVTDAAFGGNVEINNTTQATSGTIVIHAQWSWNPRMPYIWEPPPNKWIPLTGSRRATIEIDTTPADAIALCRATVWLFEVG